MPTIVLGINHKTAPVALREKAIFPADKLSLYLADLATQENIEEAVILSTCNRSEIYCITEDRARLQNWLIRQHQLEAQELASYWYVLEEQAAIQHIMQVACGLDSMVLGESQILGQMKNAFSESCAAGIVGPSFNRLFQQVFAVAKEIRTHTAIGACPVSVASTAVGLARQALPQITSSAVLLIGAGDTASLILRHLRAHEVRSINIINRSVEHAAALAEAYAADYLPFEQLLPTLLTADVVFTATSSTLPIIDKALMEKVVAARNGKPLHIIDVSVPRNVAADVAGLETVNLYCIDDLKNAIQHNLRGREHAAEKAREVIEQRCADFFAWQQSINKVTSTIRAYRSQIEDVCLLELNKARRQLQRGEDPARVLESFAYAFTNKLLHTPSVQLRQAGIEGRFDILQLAQQLFAIPETGLEIS